MSSRLESDVRRAIQHVTATLESAAPVLGAEFWSWVADNSPRGDVESFFIHPDRFPFLKLPYWILSEHSERSASRQFLQDLTRSSMCGYCHIRLVDDAVDESDPKATSLLPLGAFLQAEFMSPYGDHFPSESDVQSFVKHTWAESAEWTYRDSRSEEIDEAEFLEVCAKKMSATNMPVLAACRYGGGGAEDADAWLAVVDALGAFEQFIDDFFDWHIDLRMGQNSYLLSEAGRRTDSEHGRIQWILTDGLNWVHDQLRRLHARVRLASTGVRSDHLRDHLHSRWIFVERTLADVESGARSLATLRFALENQRELADS